MGFPFPLQGHTFMYLNPLTPMSLRHRRGNRTAQQRIPVRTCDTEAPAQSTRAQGARWHGLPFPPPRLYVYLRLLISTGLCHRRRNRTAQQPILIRACDAEVPAQSSALKAHVGMSFPIRIRAFFLVVFVLHLAS